MAAPLTITKTWKQPELQSTDEWISKQWYIYTVKHSVIKKK